MCHTVTPSAEVGIIDANPGITVAIGGTLVAGVGITDAHSGTSVADGGTCSTEVDVINADPRIQWLYCWYTRCWGKYK